MDDASDSELTQDTYVDYAVYPLYPKLRLTAADLATLAADMAPLFRLLVTPQRSSGVTVEGWFSQNGAYLRELYEVGTEPELVEKFVQSVRLSRYVGVLRWFLDGEALADIVCDTTDILRDPAPRASILGIFFFNRPQAAAAAAAVGDSIPGAVII